MWSWTRFRARITRWRSRCLADGDEGDRVDQLGVGEPAVEVPLIGPLLDVYPAVQDGVDAQVGDAHDAT
jgi:hypothetical protein